MNKSKIYTRPKKYNGYVNLKEPMYRELGLGSWLGENAGNILQTAGGAIATAIGTGLIATGIGAAPGAALASGGIGMMGSGAKGFSNTATENKIEKSKSDLINKQDKLSYLTSLNNRLQNENMSMGNGGFINYKTGSKHNESGKGVLVDQQGNPVENSKQPPAALTERGEITYVFPDGKSLVMSEKLGTVERFNKIKNKYKVRLGKDLDGNDPIARGGLLKDMNNLAAWQESKQPTPKSIEGLPIAGGGIELEGFPPMYPLPPYSNNTPWKPFDPSLSNLLQSNSQTNAYPSGETFSDTWKGKGNTNIPGLGPVDLTGYTGKNTTTTSRGSTKSTKPLDIATINTSTNEDWDMTSFNEETIKNFEQPKIGLSKFNSDNFSQASTLYDPVKSTLLPAAIQGASTIIGNLAMAKNIKAPRDYNPSQIQAPSVSYEADRQSARRQATIARNSGLSALRNTGVSRGGFSAGASGISAGVQGNLNDALSKSYQSEENTNKQLKMSADSANAQSKNYAGMFNAQRTDQYNASKLPFYTGAIGGIQGMTSDLQSAFKMRDYLGINSTRTGYQIVKDPRTGKLKMEPIKNFFERYNQE